MRKLILAAGFHGTIAVGFGAWAAHGAQNTLPLHSIDWIKTGAAYQLWHAVALLGIAGLADGRLSVRFVTICGLAFGIGTLLFSGSLYAMAFYVLNDTSQVFWLVYLTPLGGVLLILGWVLLFLAAFKKG